MLDAADTSALRDRYDRDGFVGPIEVSPATRGDALAALYETYLARCREKIGREVMIKPHLVSPDVAAIGLSPGAVDPIRAVLGEDVLMWSSSFFVKTAGGGKTVGWHQDSHDWGLSPVDGIATLWVALTPSTVESGAVKFLPGTHRLGVVAHDHTFDPGDLLSLGQKVDAPIDETQAVDMTLAPGEASIHNSLVIHGGGPNQAAHDRVGLIFNYIRADVRQARGVDGVTHVCGARPDVFVYERPATVGFADDEILELEAALRRPSGFNDMAGK